MKIFTFSRFPKAQAAAEYLLILGLVVFVTMAALQSMLPKITNNTKAGGYAQKYFSKILDRLLGP